jgi:hypothetical protein
MLLMLAAGAIWAQGQGVYPFTFDYFGATSNVPWYCDPQNCEQDLTIPSPFAGQVYVIGTGSCYSGMYPHVESGVAAGLCTAPVFLIATVNYQPQQYWTDFNTLTTADGMLANAVAYEDIWGWFYPYWQATDTSDCYDDAQVQRIPIATRC